MLEKAMSATPAASAQILGSRSMGKEGIVIRGSPAGTGPIVLTPAAPSPRIRTVRDATIMAAEVDGINGSNRGAAASIRKAIAPIARVGRWVVPIFAMNSVNRGT